MHDGLWLHKLVNLASRHRPVDMCHQNRCHIHTLAYVQGMEASSWRAAAAVLSLSREKNATKQAGVDPLVAGELDLGYT